MEWDGIFWNGMDYMELDGLHGMGWITWNVMGLFGM
jgi:hypothetical protein